MKVSNRELVLAWLTGSVALLGLTYWLGLPKVEEWKETNKTLDRFQSRIVVAERTLTQKEQWEERLNTIRQRLPQHPVGKDVTAELLKTLERTAQDNGLILLRREPDKEKNVGDLYEVAINCTWEANLEPLVRFLYAIHTQGVILDIRQLSVTPVPGQSGRLKGGFTVDCAYTRTTSPEAAEGSAPPQP